MNDAIALGIRVTNLEAELLGAYANLRTTETRAVEAERRAARAEAATRKIGIAVECAYLGSTSTANAITTIAEILGTLGFQSLEEAPTRGEGPT